MITQQHTLASGRVITLTMPDWYALVATDVDIPNAALTDITDLITFGMMTSGMPQDNEKKRLEGNRRFLMSQFQLAALCIQEPKLILRGDVPDGALTPADLTPRDLRDISEFFQTGGRERVSATTNNESATDTHDDSAGAAVGKTAE